MVSFLKKPRTWRPGRLLAERDMLREQALAVEAERLSRVESLKTDPLEFFRQILGFEPTDYLILVDYLPRIQICFDIFGQ